MAYPTSVSADTFWHQVGMAADEEARKSPLLGFCGYNYGSIGHEDYPISRITNGAILAEQTSYEIEHSKFDLTHPTPGSIAAMLDNNAILTELTNQMRLLQAGQTSYEAAHSRLTDTIQAERPTPELIAAMLESELGRSFSPETKAKLETLYQPNDEQNEDLNERPDELTEASASRLLDARLLMSAIPGTDILEPLLVSLTEGGRPYQEIVDELVQFCMQVAGLSPQLTSAVMEGFCRFWIDEELQTRAEMAVWKEEENFVKTLRGKTISEEDVFAVICELLKEYTVYSPHITETWVHMEATAELNRFKDHAGLA